MRELVSGSDPVLRQPCKQVQTVDSYIVALVDELIQYLHQVNALKLQSYGIAAPQVGESIQLFVISTPAIELVVMNPEITKTYGQHNWIEGCLSLPGQYYMVRRPKLIKFQYLGLDGQMHSGKYHDDYAGVVEHEIQHLSGTMIDDIGEWVKREAIFQ